MTHEPSAGATLRFLLDEDLPPDAARIARKLGIDAVSVHEVGRTGLTDEEQLAYAVGENRVMVTRHRDDYLELTRRTYATNQPHGGVLIVRRRTPNTDPRGIAHAVATWARRYHDGGPGIGFVDFV